VTYFEAVDEHGGIFIVRPTHSHHPWVRAAWIDGDLIPLRNRPPLALHRSDQNAGPHMDLDVAYERDNGKRLVGFHP
jgi:hypothetical protein